MPSIHPVMASRLRNSEVKIGFFIIFGLFVAAKVAFSGTKKYFMKNIDVGIA
jgi:nitrate reductase NapE component